MRRHSYQFSVISYQKNKIIIIGIFLLLLVNLIGCVKREIRNIDSKGTNIICFGDSITFGYGAATGQDYPSVLAKMVNFPVINVGIDGDDSTEALKRLKNDVLDRDPLLVIIEFGGNDFLRKIPVEITIDNIRKMVDGIQAKGVMVAITDISVGIFLKEYRKAFYNLAREKGVIFIPSIIKSIFTNPELKSDFIHPNSDGYNIIAQRIYRVIIPYLNKNSLIKKFGK